MCWKGTTVLERANFALKDNRIPPTGFTTTHSTYDTCAIVGGALTDPDFNVTGTTEGSGTDMVHYHIPLNGYAGTISVTATMLYQSVPPSFLTEMFAHQSAAIDSFEQFYNNADNTPLTVSQDTLLNISIPSAIPEHRDKISFYVTPAFSTDGKVTVHAERAAGAIIRVYDQGGNLVLEKGLNEEMSVTSLKLPQASGIYYISLIKPNLLLTRKVFRM